MESNTEKLICSVIRRTRDYINYLCSRYQIKRQDADECLSEAMIILIEGARRYQEDKGVPFWHFIRKRLKGSVIDYLRRARSHKGHMCWDFPVENLEALVNTRLAEVLDYVHWSGSLHNYLITWTELSKYLCPEQSYSRKELTRILRRGLDVLSSQEKRVIHQVFYLDQRSEDSFRRELGVGKSRVSKIRNRAIERLRKAFECEDSPLKLAYAS